MKPTCVATVVALIVALSTFLPSYASAGPLDHFKCYKVVQALPINEFVELEDQFDTQAGVVEQALVRIALFFCNPTAKFTSLTGAPTPIQNRDGHLKMYLIVPPTPGLPRDVAVLNQFGEQRLEVFQPVALAVPTQKFPHPAPQGLDHFKCYIARGESVGEKVALRDQFDILPETVTVLRPVLFCNPVQKTRDEKVTPIENPKDHLTCYSFTPATPRSRVVLANNQFGRETLIVSNARYLCVPSQKETPSG